MIVPCKNEESNIERCLNSVPWVDETFVIDSQSTDRTVELAKGLGAKVIQFHYEGGWPKKKNWALDNLAFSHDWVLILDADECLPLEAEKDLGMEGMGHGLGGTEVDSRVRKFLESQLLGKK